VLRILLTEVLGYDNVQLDQRFNSMNATQILNRISGKRGKVPETMINTEVWVPAGFNMEALVARGNLINAGPLGVIGRFGWFMPTYTVESMWNKSRLTVDHWKTLRLDKVSSLFSLKQQSDALKDFLTRPDPQSRGRYCDDGMEGCENGLFVSQQAQCSRAQHDCAVLLSSTPDFDGGVLRRQISDLELNVAIAWIGSHLDSFVCEQVSVGAPLLFFNWIPNDLTSGSKFTRVMFPSCQASGGVTPIDCDFEVNQLTKVMWSVLKTHTPEAHHVVSSMSLTQEDLDLMLRQYERQKRKALRSVSENEDVLESVACEWARENALQWMKWIPETVSSRTPIYIGGLFPLTGPHWRQPAIVPGAQMAIDFVNNDPNILKDYDLYLLLKDTQCKVDVAMTQYLQYAINTTYPIAGILGPACSETAEPIASVAKHFNTIVISYSAEALQLTNRAMYPLFLRTIPHILQNGAVYIALFKTWGWTQTALLAEDGKYFPEYNAFLKDRFLTNSIQVAYDRKMPRMANMTDAAKYIEELKKKDVRIIILTSFEKAARAVICEAFRQGMTAENGYIWFLPAWFTKQWYQTDIFNSLMAEHIPCTSADMNKAVQGHFLLNTAFLGHGDSQIVGNVTVHQWEQMYTTRIKELQLRELSPYASYAYDAVMVFALGLDKLLTDDPSALESLHTDKTTQKFMHTLNELKFSGASGPVQFDGAERTGIININQHIGEIPRLVGQYMPDKLNLSERLSVNESAIVWLTMSGTRPSDGIPAPKLCNIEGFRALLNVDCDTAIVVANLIGIGIFIIIMVILLFTVKKRYDAKVRRIRDILGLPLDTDFVGLDKWQIPREHVVINRKVGEGAFGTVYGGEALIDNLWEAVAVKALKLGATAEVKLDFLSEAEMMKRLEHVNIVRLLGVCTRCEPVYAVMEFMLHGNLKNFLLARRCMVGQVTKEAEDVNPQGLTKMALDVATGLQYLSENKFLHRDLACRNCLVHANKTVKIGDFGLARHIYDSDYYQYSKRGLFPVRWMAPESLSSGLFTVASDVWSFGVVLYEIITFGCLPYPTLTNKAAVDYVKAGNRITLPVSVTEDLDELIRSCWYYDYKLRTPISKIRQQLEDNPSIICACLETPSSAQLQERSEVLEINLQPQNRARNRARQIIDHPQRCVSISSHDGGTTPGVFDLCESPSAQEFISEPFCFTGSTPAVDELSRRPATAFPSLETRQLPSVGPSLGSVARKTRALVRIPSLIESFFRSTGRSMSVDERTTTTCVVVDDSCDVASQDHCASKAVARCYEMTVARSKDPSERLLLNHVAEDVTPNSATVKQGSREPLSSLPPSLESRGDSDYCSQHSKD